MTLTSRAFGHELLEPFAAAVAGLIGPLLFEPDPLVLPMNYALHGDEVIFRTGPGTKLDAARGRPACFEIDGFDRQGRSGWSVVVRGRLEEVTRYDSALLEVVADLAEPWMQAPRPNVLRLVPTTITGRRIAPRPIEAT